MMPRIFSQRAFALLLVALFSATALAGCVSDAPSDDEGDAGFTAATDACSHPDDVETATKFFYKDQTEMAKIQTLVPVSFEDEHPEAAAFLKNFQVPGADEDAYMLKVNKLSDEGAQEPTRDVAHEYVDQNTELVDSWFEGTGADATAGEGQALVVGMPSGWVGEMVRSHIVAKLLEDRLGYDVTIQSLAAGPIYEGLATGDIDVFVGAWLPLQQEHYASVQDDVAILGNNLPSDAVGLYLAVPQYLVDQGITSIADLDANKELFDGTITGIESGAGMMITAKDRMDSWDVYGLEDWTLQESSTGAMLAAYDTAVKNNDPIVVTIWKPHYAYAKWSGEDAMVNLADPGCEVPADKLE